jgi:hypothetical protein
MMISWLDLVSVYVTCIVLHEFILICVVLELFMLIASKCIFFCMLLWLYKLILNPVNFLTDVAAEILGCCNGYLMVLQ